MDNRVFSKVKISAISSVVPKEKISLMEFSQEHDKKDIERIMLSTGISEITVAEEGMTASDYAFEAANKLFLETNTLPKDIDGLIYLTETPDIIYPGVATILQDRLGLRKNIICTDLRYACSGFVYGLFYSSLLVESGYCNNVLFLAGDTLSQFINSHDRSIRVVNGDAAFATLVSKSDVDICSYYNFYADGSGINSLLIPAGGSRMPSKHGITDVLEFDRDGNGRTKENLYMNGMDIMIFATKVVPELINNILKELKLDVNDIDLYAFHQANKMIIDRIAKKLNISSDKYHICMEHTGNCGFNSIPLMLCTDYFSNNSNLHNVIACGFGAGLIAAVASLNLSGTKLIKTFEV